MFLENYIAALHDGKLYQGQVSHSLCSVRQIISVYFIIWVNFGRIRFREEMVKWINVFILELCCCFLFC